MDNEVCWDSLFRKNERIRFEWTKKVKPSIASEGKGTEQRHGRRGKPSSFYLQGESPKQKKPNSRGSAVRALCKIGEKNPISPNPAGKRTV